MRFFKDKSDLRERCRIKYGDEFIAKYDKINAGGSIGGFKETKSFLDMVESVRKETSDKTCKRG